jgi:hypothetical protein
VIRRLATLALLLCSGAMAARAQTPAIRIDDAGPGVGPGILARAIALPHVVIAPSSERFIIARGGEQPLTVIVLGRETVVEGKVRGDVIVVGADLYMHPGASITGRAIAIGGGVYESMLATVGGGVLAFRDFTYDLTPIPGGYSLRYRELSPVVEPELQWGGIFGLGLPTYDRSNGLSLGVGPRYSPRGLGLVIEPRITYRSQLGAWDPSVGATYDLNRLTSVRLVAGRATASNDRWIRGDFVNSAIFFYNGDDTRNYYRATGGTARIERRWESVTGALSTYAGGRLENASSVRPGLDATGGPWTLLARKDPERDDRLRHNPAIDEGRVTSAIAGGVWMWTDGQVVSHVDADAEANADFAQLTVDGGVVLPTFGTQRLHVDLHWVTGGGEVPNQRYAYLGGPGTLPSLELLQEGGDQLAFVDFRYDVPIDRVQLPFVGAPIVTLREALGGAAVGRFPTIHQNLGVRVAGGPIYVEWMLDPVARKSHLGFGLSMAR